MSSVDNEIKAIAKIASVGVDPSVHIMLDRFVEIIGSLDDDEFYDNGVQLTQEQADAIASIQNVWHQYAFRRWGKWTREEGIAHRVGIVISALKNLDMVDEIHAELFGLMRVHE